MTTFTDTNTNKVYTIAGNTVTQSRNGVVLGTETFSDLYALASWVKMMGFDAVLCVDLNDGWEKSWKEGAFYSVVRRTEASIWVRDDVGCERRITTKTMQEAGFNRKYEAPRFM